MSSPNNEFAISLGTAKFFDTSGNFVFSAETLVDNSIDVTMEAIDIEGAQNAQLLYTHYIKRRVMATLTSATISPDYIAVNAGKSIVLGTDNVYTFDECVPLTAGSGTLAKTPIGTALVRKPDGTTITVTPSGTTITVPGLTTETVFVTYVSAVANVEKITLDGSTPPMIGKLVIQTKIYSRATGGHVSTCEITIPRYSIDGNFTLSLTADGASQIAINGKALAYTTGGCDESVYAEVRFIPVSASSVPVIAIAATPEAVGVTTGNPVTLVVYGLRSNTAPFIIPNASCTFVSAAPATATVNAAGVITKVANGTTTVTVTYNGITDVVQVTAS